MKPRLTYRVLPDNDLMQMIDGRDVCPLGVCLAPDTAALFSAAPEMLEALKKAKTFIEAHSGPTGVLKAWGPDVRTAINEAIAKATGTAAIAEGLKTLSTILDADQTDANTGTQDHLEREGFDEALNHYGRNK